MKRDLREFRRAGVDRDEDTRKKVRALNDELVTIGQEFDRNIREGAKKVPFAPAELAGLPERLPQGASARARTGRCVLTTDYPDYHPFMAYARSREGAGALLAGLQHPRPRPTPRSSPGCSPSVTSWRTLLGYANWADYTTENKMIGSGKAASEFVDRIAAASRAQRSKARARALARPQAQGPAGSDPVRGLGLRVLPRTG